MDDRLLARSRLLKARLWWARLDVMPFVTLYVLCFSFIAWSLGVDRAENDVVVAQLQVFVSVLLPVCLALQMLLFLTSQWSVNVEVTLGYVSASKLSEARYVLAYAAENAGKDRIVPLRRKDLADYGLSGDGKSISFPLLGQTHLVRSEFFEFQKVVYHFDVERMLAVKLEYPIVGKVSEFLSCSGLDEEGFRLSVFTWGYNLPDIPTPEFLDLYVEHLVAPFFVFQVLCLVLWSLDDYWYYSAFTLFMLMFFEAMQCKQRQNSLQQLRNMRRASVPTYVYRNKTWIVVPSEALVPGDVISVAAVSSGSSSGAVEEDQLLVSDALLLCGSCVVNEAILTGESVPQIKESLSQADGSGGGESVVDLAEGHIAAAGWKRHLLLSGTKLVQHEYQPVEGVDIPAAPDQGCLAVVVRTGFVTEQGSLMRKILFATERVNANSAESFYFICVLVFFAAIASAVVLQAGLNDPTRNKFKLLLHCIMIVTSVVPPELPMELSLAVTNSLAALSHQLIFCTEPFRIPFAGKLDVLCFDKTGTLTKDEMILRGLVGCEFAPRGVGVANSAEGGFGGDGAGAVPGAAITDVLVLDASEPPSPEQCPDIVLCVLAGCNSLHRDASSGEIIGDPLEIASFAASGFEAQSGRGGAASSSRDIGLKILANTGRSLRLSLRHRFQFTSTLKRMSVVADISVGSPAAAQQQTWLLTKGAPEVLEERLAHVPSFYRKTYQHHMRAGKRVLVLAGKPCQLTDADIRACKRDDVETKLHFLSFVVFDTDLKPDSKGVIKELRESRHKVIMITGDSAFTASDVGRKLGFLKKAPEKPLLFLQTATGPSGDVRVAWRLETSNAVDDSSCLCPDDVAFSSSGPAIAELEKRFSLCATGPALQTLQRASVSAGGQTQYKQVLGALAPCVALFARMSPVQKEEVVQALNAQGHFTLMCGDGTNDVGALKAAHVGVSIINDPKFENMIEKATKSAKGPAARRERAIKELNKQEEDPTIVKLGDASIASPFTARRTSIDSVLTVVRQGRCTLVTTIQVFKILALNCLVSAYMMSALYLQGLKQGDTQMTASGLVSAALFFFLSQAKPLGKLASTKPPSSAFAASILSSIAGQFLTHFGSLLAILHLSKQHISPDDSTLAMDGKFQPNVVNSAMFLLTVVMQINNFVINYRGHPFTQSIQDNAALWRSVQVIYVVLLIVAGGQFEPLNDLLQLAPFPSSSFQGGMLAVLVSNFVLCYTVEFLARKLE